MKTSMLVLMAYLVLFGLLVIMSLYDTINHTEIVSIGVPIPGVNFMIFILSAIGFIKTLWHIVAF